jgi:hypothetical protein
MREREDTSKDVQEVTGVGIPGLTPRVAARLCNFKTNDWKLWPDHEAWLRDKVIPIVRDPQGAWIDVLAYASARGTTKSNKTLSDRRRETVIEFLKKESGNPNLPTNRNHPFGEELSGPDENDNNGYFRAVDVYVYGGPMPSIVPPVQVGSMNFKIRVLGSAGAGAPPPRIPVPINFGGEVYFFELVDLDKKQKANLAYIGEGVSIGVPKLPGFTSVGTVGNFTEFTLSQPSTLFSFAGRAGIITEAGASVPGKGIGGDIQLKFKSRSFIRRGVTVTSKKPAQHGFIRMDTGPGVSIQFSGATNGNINLVPRKTFPHTGP